MRVGGGFKWNFACAKWKNIFGYHLFQCLFSLFILPTSADKMLNHSKTTKDIERQKCYCRSGDSVEKCAWKIIRKCAPLVRIQNIPVIMADKELHPRRSCCCCCSSCGPVFCVTIKAKRFKFKSISTWQSSDNILQRYCPNSCCCRCWCCWCSCSCLCSHL